VLPIARDSGGGAGDRSGSIVTRHSLVKEDATVISEGAAPLVINIAKKFITLIRGIEPRWQTAYLRFVSHGSAAEAKASYAHAAGVDIIDVLKHKEFFHAVTRQGQELLSAHGKEHGLFLLIADSSFNYEIKFEYEDLGKWGISKIGGTGIPEGFG
jgi:hypothetical protein